MRPLPHGYTNETLGDAVTVVKRYAGPDAALRAAREYAALVALPERVPIPPVLDHTATTITLGFVAGMHGKDMIMAGHAEPVLRTCGAVLQDIHKADFKHGDFGPHNVLLDAITFAATAVLDWEFAVHRSMTPSQIWPGVNGSSEPITPTVTAPSPRSSPPTGPRRPGRTATRRCWLGATS
jgi:hypothetical protein